MSLGWSPYRHIHEITFLFTILKVRTVLIPHRCSSPRSFATARTPRWHFSGRPRRIVRPVVPASVSATRIRPIWQRQPNVGRETEKQRDTERNASATMKRLYDRRNYESRGKYRGWEGTAFTLGLARAAKRIARRELVEAAASSNGISIFLPMDRRVGCCAPRPASSMHLCASLEAPPAAPRLPDSRGKSMTFSTCP